jgi:hypothetical protein
LRQPGCGRARRRFQAIGWNIAMQFGMIRHSINLRWSHENSD